MSRLVDFILSIEDAGNDTELPTNVDLADSREKTETGAKDAKSISKEITINSDQSEEFGGVIERMDEIATEMWLSVNSGKGLSPEATAFAHHAIQSNIERLGMASSDLLPTLESLGFGKVSLEATETALQKIVRVIKQLYHSMMHNVRLAIDKVIAYFTKAKVSISDLEKRLLDVSQYRDIILKMVNSSTQSVNSLAFINNLMNNGFGQDLKMHVPGFSNLRYMNKADPKSINEGLNQLKGCTSVWMNMYITRIKEVYAIHTTRFNKITVSDDDLLAAQRIVKSIKSIKQVGLMSGDKTMECTSEETIPHLNNQQNTDKMYIFSKYRLVDKEGRKALLLGGAEQYDVPSPQEINSIIDKLKDIIINIKKIPDHLSEKGDLTTARIESVKAMELKLAGDDLINAQRIFELTAYKRRMYHVQKDYTVPITQVFSHAYNVCSSALSYLEIALTEYKRKLDKKP